MILESPGFSRGEYVNPEEREALIRGGFDLEPPQWVTCPKDWRKRYRDYMKKRKIPYLERRSGKTLWFLISKKYRPHRWKL